MPEIKIKYTDETIKIFKSLNISSYSMKVLSERVPRCMWQG